MGAGEALVPPVGEPAVLGRHPWLRRVLFAVLMALAVLVGHAAQVADTVPFLSPVPAVAVLWLAGSPGRRERVLDALALVAAVALVVHLTGAPPRAACALAVATAVQALAAAWTHRLLRPAGLRLRTARDLAVLAAGAGAGALVSAPLALLGGVLTSPHPVVSAGLWLLHGSVSAFVVLAAVLHAGGGAPGEGRRAPLPERCAVAAGFALVYVLSFWVWPQAGVVFGFLPVAVWAAVRESLRAVTVHLLVLTGAVVVAARCGRDPWAASPPELHVLVVEAFLGAFAVTVLVLALARAEGERNGRLVREQADLLTAVFASIDDAVTVVDAHGRLLLRNRAADDLFGGTDVPGMADPASGEGFFRLDGTRTEHEDLPVVRALRGTPVVAVEGRLVSTAHPRGRLVRVSAHPLPPAPGAPWSGGAVAALHDVTDLRAAVAELERAHDLFASVLDAATDHAIVACDPQGRVSLFNEGAERILGRREQDVLGRSVLELYEPEDLPAIARGLGLEGPGDLFATGRGGRPVTFRARYLRADGSAVPVSVTSAAMTAADGRVTGYTSLATDITAQLAAEQRLAHQALHDALTGLANRTLLHRRLEEAAAQPLGLLYVDLDGFKAVNDTAGHAAGDAVLVEVARRLRACVRPGDTVARLGGDEFAVLCPAAPREAVTATAARVLQALRPPVALAGGDAVVGASVGVRWSAGGPAAAPAEQVLREADEAMYEAKRAGKDQVVVHGGRCPGARALPVRAGS
ncbi:diguanylate cyclase domain-containing protein [Kineococcus sp. SYSU DK006]|uniref:diguanylate cyclase domain-containing protein n=1 Tax=Kineococcus sp. SYSU DK006 TaxID=3383127 RepID=UPI003D7E51AB